MPSRTYEGWTPTRANADLDALWSGKQANIPVAAVLLTSSAAANAAAIQAALDSGVPRIAFPPGDWTYSGPGLAIDHAVDFAGAASCEGGSATGLPGPGTTRLTYTGTGVAISLLGTGTEGRENLHLRDFSLWGTVAAAGGICAGSVGFVSKSSIKNVHVRGFTKVGAYGIRLQQVQEFLLENTYTQSNYDGIVNLPGDVSTTVRGLNCTSRTNTRYGTYLAGTAFTGCAFFSLLNESNGSDGLHIVGSGVSNTDFHSIYGEGNNLSGGTAPVVITGSVGVGAAAHLNFFGGYIAEAVSTLAISLDYAEEIAFYGVALRSYAAGFMSATANTFQCQFNTTVAGCFPSNVTGNAIERVYVNTGAGPTRFRVTVVNGGVVGLPFSSGVATVTDLTNHHSAIVSLNGSANTASVLADPTSSFSAASGTGGKINFFFSGSYAVQNSTGGTIDLLLSVVNADGL